MNKIIATFFGILIAALVTLGGKAAAAERVETSCADCPSYSGAFSIENTTGITINYQYRWGSSHPWKRMSLARGYTETHRYPLGDNKNGKAPVPYIRYDKIGGDGSRFTPQEYRMQFHAVGYAGYGPARDTTQPKRYYFRFAPDGKTLELLAR